jgi:hypothetical protein
MIRSRASEKQGTRALATTRIAATRACAHAKLRARGERATAQLKTGGSLRNSAAAHGTPGN